MKRVAEQPSDERGSRAKSDHPEPAGCEWAPKPGVLPFFTGRFSASQLEFRENSFVFNGSVVASDDPDASAIPISASDMAAVSDWFKGVVRQRKEMAGNQLDRVRLPCDVPQDVAEAVVTAMYEGSITVSVVNFKPLLQLADSLMMPELLKVCQKWGVEAVQEEGATFQWLLECHRTMQSVQASMPQLQLKLGSSLVWACLHSMDLVGFETLKVVLTEIWERKLQNGNSDAAEPGAEMWLLRAFLNERFGTQCCPEAILLLLLLKLGQQGLSLEQLIPCLNIGGIHWEEMQCIHKMELRAPLASVDDSLAIHRLLLGEALATGKQSTTGGRDTLCGHAACFIAAGTVLQVEQNNSSSRGVGDSLSNVDNVQVFLRPCQEGLGFTVQGITSTAARSEYRQWFMYCFSSGGVIVDRVCNQQWRVHNHARDEDRWHYNYYNVPMLQEMFRSPAVDKVAQEKALDRVVGIFRSCVVVT